MRASAAAALAVAVATVGLILAASGGPGSYRVQLPLLTANGLREGSQVKIGGVAVGEVSALRLGRGDAVMATLALDREHGPIGRDATAKVVTSNLLGSKFVELQRGTRADALPSGRTLPADRVSYPVDLDELLNTLDTDTRTRLRILINEAGVGLTGREADFSRALELLPHALDDATALLDDIAGGNRTLERLVTHASRFMHRMDAERTALARLVQAASGTMRTTAARHAELGETLRRAPGTLASAETFLAELRRATRPLGPAARALAATAPQLSTTLAELPAFQRAAAPALRQARRVAPAITRLSTGATPVLRRSRPTLDALSRFATAMAPLSKTLRISIDNALGLTEGWARAIQGRDGLGHSFHFRAVLGLETLRTLVDRLAPSSANKKRRPARRRPRAATPAPPAAPAGDGAPNAATPSLDKVAPALPKLLEPVKKLLAPPKTDERQRPAEAGEDLLDYLLKP